jgi:DHA1 family tetracycline resistance protein-like MFS transporter
MTSTVPSRSYGSALLFIFLTILIDTAGMGIIYPVLPNLIETLTGEGLSGASVWGGWLTAAYAVMQFIAAPLIGSLSDKFGRRPILLAALVGFGIDYLFLAFAPTIWWLFIGRVIAGITGASYTTASAYVADISTDNNRAQNFGLIGAAFGLGFTIGPVIGGLLGSIGERVPFFAAAGLSLLTAFYGYFVLPETLAKENRRDLVWNRANPISALLKFKKYPHLYKLLAGFFLYYTAGHVIQSTWSFFTLYKFDWNEKAVGISLGIFGLLIAWVQAFLTKYVTKKYGNNKSIIIGLIAYIIGMFLFSFVSQSWMLYVIMIPYSIGGITIPAIQSVITSQVPNNQQGELQGMLSSLISATAVLGPPIMNSLFAHFTSPSASVQFPGAPFLFGGVLTVVALMIIKTGEPVVNHYKVDKENQEK